MLRLTGFRRPLAPCATAALIVALAAAPPPAQAQVGAVSAAATTASEWVADQLCLAYYEPHGAWYAAHVLSVSGDSVRVRHFDGWEDTVTRERLRRDEIAVGDTLDAFHRADSKWYIGVVKERNGMEVVVEYSDGEQESLWLKFVRILSDVPTAGG